MPSGPEIKTTDIDIQALDAPTRRERRAPEEDAGKLLTDVDPSTGEAFMRISHTGPEEVDKAAETAAFTSALWRGTSFEERGARLRRLAKLIRSQADDIAEMIAREQGKPRLEALTLEVLPALDHLKFIIGHAERYHAGLSVEPRHPFYTHKRAHYLYDAIGVVALITPSPLPFAVPLVQVTAALAMGNAVVLKPSELTPLSGLRIGELCSQAGFPPGLVNVAAGHPEEAMRLAAHPKIDKVFVTGTLDAGQHIMAMAGCAPRPVVLCLGGKHSSVVAGDADVNRAARGVVWGALANCGQNCGAVERVYVEESIASRFIERLLQEVDGLRIGNALEDGVDIGPLISAERRSEVHRKVTEAVADGARLLRGGEMPEGSGFFYPPTVLLGPPEDCRLMREETLGPVIPIVVVESVERAILLANDNDYALSASGWTKSDETAERLMIGLQAGVVTINDLLYSFGEPAATWSGYRKSGMGQNHGTPGLREMSRQRFVSHDPAVTENSAFAYPYDGEAAEILKTSIDYLHGGGVMERMRALFRLVRMKRFRNRVPVRSLLWPSRRQVK